MYDIFDDLLIAWEHRKEVPENFGRDNYTALWGETCKWPVKPWCKDTDPTFGGKLGCDVDRCALRGCQVNEDGIPTQTTCPLGLSELIDPGYCMGNGCAIKLENNYYAHVKCTGDSRSECTLQGVYKRTM